MMYDAMFIDYAWIFFKVCDHSNETAFMDPHSKEFSLKPRFKKNPFHQFPNAPALSSIWP
jgi:hypothetical protein